MFGPFIEADFPLVNLGAAMYRRTESSPFAMASTPELAMDIVARLNAGEMARAMGMPGFPPMQTAGHIPGAFVTWGSLEVDRSLAGPAFVAAEPEPIPELVYWSEEGGNFYGMTSRQGQGQAFFDKWFLRRDEFPTSAADEPGWSRNPKD